MLLELFLFFAQLAYFIFGVYIYIKDEEAHVSLMVLWIAIVLASVMVQLFG